MGLAIRFSRAVLSAKTANLSGLVFNNSWSKKLWSCRLIRPLLMEAV